MEPAAHATHVGPGVALLAEQHARRRAEREAREADDDDAPLDGGE